MRAMRPIVGFHQAEPQAGSIRAFDGRQADLFNYRHYPVSAVCRACAAPIRAESFYRPFEHLDEGFS